MTSLKEGYKVKNGAKTQIGLKTTVCRWFIFYIFSINLIRSFSKINTKLIHHSSYSTRIKSMFQDICHVELESGFELNIQKINSPFDHLSGFGLDKFLQLSAVFVEIGIGFFQNFVFIITPHQITISIRVLLIFCVKLMVIVEPINHFFGRLIGLLRW
jgi:hypothetical protein